jgi:nitrogen fixation/metabolism regulation signal transduction histidine kinase
MEELSHFAPAERTVAEQILKEYDLIGSQKFFTEIFGAMTGIGALIDKNRQIVYANDEFLALMGIKSLESVLGKRPGEVISCIHSAEEPAGCGTSRACAYCGAVNVILESQKTGKKAKKETQISSMVDGKHKSWDLNIFSTPISFNGDLFYVLILQDISDLKRRKALERIFFHDLLNSVGGLNGLLTVLKEGTNPVDANEIINLSEEVSRNILEEILLQRDIREAENGELKVTIDLANSAELLDSVIGKIGFHEVGKGRMIAKAANSVNLDFETDKILLQRVMINLLKNALEATEAEGTVKTGFDDAGDRITYWVKNDQVMPEEVQMQMFQRSFSTKGIDRGIGSYSIRLITENYLKGKVSFISNETLGTVFSIELNIKFPSDHADLR